MTKREFLAASAGAGLALLKAGSAFAQEAAAAAPRAGAKIPRAPRKPPKLFKSSAGIPKWNCRHAGRLVDRPSKRNRAGPPPPITCRNRRTFPKPPGWWIGMASC